MPTTKPQDQIIETIEGLQTRLLETNAKLVAELNNLVPDEVSKRVNERLSAMPRPDIPQPSEAVEVAFDLVERVAESSRRFADEMVKVWSPEQAGKASAPATKKAAEKKTAAAKKTPAKKAATKKATAKKAAAKTTTAKKSASAKKATKKAPAKKAAAKKTTK